jgi:hypothetical protein
MVQSFKDTSSAMVEPRGLIETRTRVSFFLPAHKSNELKAVREVAEYLETQQQEGTVTGFTRSSILQPVFVGAWWNEALKAWQRERVSLFIIDYQYGLEEMEMEKVLSGLKENVARIYKERGSAQDELWIIAQGGTRYV